MVDYAPTDLNVNSSRNRKRLWHIMSNSSQSLTELLCELRELGVRLWVDVNGLRCDAPKGSMSADLVQRLKANKREITRLLRTGRIEQADWQDDAILTAGIAPSDLQTAHKARDAKAILLTGSTGFLGAFLLAELVKQTAAKIYCLVRVEQGDSQSSVHDQSWRRIQDALREFGIWDDDFTDRIVVVPGDLRALRLGIDAAQYRQMVSEIDAVLHNGALVHHGLPYTSLKSTNVEGTREAIVMACEANARFHFVSSLSVLPPTVVGDRSTFYEAEALDQIPPPQGGYNLSKWVSERLVEQAAERRLRVTVFRPGPICGDSRTGIFNENDFLCRLMQGYLVSGIAPEGELPIDVLPVDYVAKAIVWLVRARDRGDSTVDFFQRYHLIHPQPVSSNTLFEACRNEGHDIKRVHYDVWFEHLVNIAKNGDLSHPLYPLVSLFSSRRYSETVQAEGSIPFDTTAAQTALRHAPFSLPILDVSLFQRYLSQLSRASDLGIAATPLLLGAQKTQAVALDRDQAKACRSTTEDRS